MKAKFYVRVSTDEQAAEGFSLSAQEDRCRQFIQSQGWEFDGLYNDDGYSAKDLRRPGIQQMIQDVENGAFDVLVVWRLDRLVRSVMDLHFLLNLFDKYGVKFKSVTEVFDTTTATGRLFISIIGSMAQWERENLAERVKMGMERRALEGKRNGAIAPFGYELGEDGKLVPHPTEAPIVREIFEMYQSSGYLKITEWLNKQGIKTKRGGEFGIYNLQYILTNPAYVGDLRWGHRNKGKVTGEGLIFKGTHEPLVSKELFEQTQELIQRRRTRPPRVIASEYVFSGTLRCSRCGSRMIGYPQRVRNGKDKLPAYRCHGRVVKKMCNMPTILEWSVEEAFFSQMEWIADHIEVEPEEPQPNNDRRKEIEKEIERARKRRKKWQHAYAEDVITLDELKDRTNEDRKKEERLLKELDALGEEKPKLSKEEMIEKLKDLQYVWDHATRFERKELIQVIFEEIYIEVFPNPKRFHRNLAKITEYIFRS